MSGTTTPNLGLFNTNMLTDGDDFFDFDRDLNGNNNIIDAAIGKLSTLTTTDKTNLVAAINELITKLDGKTSVDLDNLSSLGQAIMDKKVEVEALLQQNGYAKFSWKENNEISNLIFQWCMATESATVSDLKSWPIAMNTLFFASAIGPDYRYNSWISGQNYDWNITTNFLCGLGANFGGSATMLALAIGII